MFRLHVLMIAALGLACAGAAPGQYLEAQSFLQKPAGRPSPDDLAYQKGQTAIDAGRWEQAVSAFGKVATDNGPRADGALYWKAYALNKLGRREEALAALVQLREAHAGSRWLDDGRALEIEIRQKSGQSVNPNSEPDDDLKLLAINGLMNSDPARAIPILQKFLQGNQSPRLRERALFVLAQSDNAQARQVLAQIARGGSNPDLQLKAIQYLGMMGSQANRQALSELYTSSNDLNVKRAVLHAFMLCGDRQRVFQAAKSEKNPDLRMDAIHQLGLMGGQPELADLYHQESSVEVKAAILHAMFLGGNGSQLSEIARTEKDPKLRLAAVHSMGLMGRENTGAALVSMYGSETDASVRREIINALFIQGNAKGLVELARRETNPEMKKAIVSKLALMGSKDATEYLMEILNK